MNEHFDTAESQLLLADDLAQSREQLWDNARTAAQVHALLALAEEIQRAGLGYRPPLDFDPSFP